MSSTDVEKIDAESLTESSFDESDISTEIKSFDESTISEIIETSEHRVEMSTDNEHETVDFWNSVHAATIVIKPADKSNGMMSSSYTGWIVLDDVTWRDILDANQDEKIKNLIIREKKRCEEEHVEWEEPFCPVSCGDNALLDDLARFAVFSGSSAEDIISSCDGRLYTAYRDINDPKYLELFYDVFGCRSLQIDPARNFRLDWWIAGASCCYGQQTSSKQFNLACFIDNDFIPQQQQSETPILWILITDCTILGE